MSTGWSSEWLDFAYMDLSAAEHLLTMRPLPVEIICYHCQQAVEKAIKAIIISYGAQGGMPKKHNLSFQYCLPTGVHFVPRLLMGQAPDFSGIVIRSVTRSSESMSP